MIKFIKSLFKLQTHKDAWDEFWFHLWDALETEGPVLDPEIAKILVEDPEGWDRHIRLLQQGKPGLEKYKKYDIIK